MSRIDYLSKNIEILERDLLRVGEMRLGFILKALSYHGFKDSISVGHFKFNSHSHDTGVSVRVFICLGDEMLDIINGTYWYSESTYGHNKFIHNKGAWDAAFEDAVKDLKKMLSDAIEKKIEKLKVELEESLKEEREKKSRFEAIFNADI